MNGFIMAPAHNKEGRSDATGAFHVGAKIFQKVHKLPDWVKFENDETSRTADRQGFLDLITKQPAGWDVFAYFGHGDSNALGSADVRGRTGATALADTLRPKLNRNAVVLLYACNTGKPGGFAEWLASDLSDLNVKVYAHLPPPGHTFMNANVVCYPGGQYVVAPKTPLWGDWYRDFHSQGNDLWARFPFMSQQEIEAELTAPGGLIGRWELGGKGYRWHTTFFGDLTVVRTEVSRKFQIVRKGKWTASKRLLTVDWNYGFREEWPLKLDYSKQTVKLIEPTGLTVTKAKRIEPPNVNPRKMFQGGGVFSMITGR